MHFSTHVAVNGATGELMAGSREFATWADAMLAALTDGSGRFERDGSGGLCAVNGGQQLYGVSSHISNEVNAKIEVMAQIQKVLGADSWKYGALEVVRDNTGKILSVDGNEDEMSLGYFKAHLPSGVPEIAAILGNSTFRHDGYRDAKEGLPPSPPVHPKTNVYASEYMEGFTAFENVLQGKLEATVKLNPDSDRKLSAVHLIVDGNHVASGTLDLRSGEVFSLSSGARDLRGHKSILQVSSGAVAEVAIDMTGHCSVTDLTSLETFDGYEQDLLWRVTLDWNANDPDAGDYCNSVWAPSKAAAIAALAEEMADHEDSNLDPDEDTYEGDRAAFIEACIKGAGPYSAENVADLVVQSVRGLLRGPSGDLSLERQTDLDLVLGVLCKYGASEPKVGRLAVGDDSSPEM